LVKLLTVIILQCFGAREALALQPYL